MAVDIIARAMAAEASSGGKDVDYGSVTNKPQINVLSKNTFNGFFLFL